MMQGECRGLLRLEVQSVRKLPSSPSTSHHMSLNLNVGSEGSQHHIDMQSNECKIVSMFRCTGNCSFQAIAFDTLGVSCYVRFPLDRLCEMNRVKHILDVTMVERHNGEIKIPIVPMLNVTLTLIYFNEAKGKFTLTALQFASKTNIEELQANNPYVTIEVEGHSAKLTEHSQENTLVVWKSNFQFMVNTSFDYLLRVRIYNKKSFKDDFIGENSISLIKAGLIEPKRETQSYVFDAVRDGKQIGKITITYSFLLS